MKRINGSETDTLRKEYDFNKLKGGIKGKYAKKYSEGTNIVLLEPEVAKVFTTDKDVNEALKLFIKIAKANYRNTNQ